MIAWWLAACVEKVVPHAGEDPVFALDGAHATLPCASCHGEATPRELPTACSACHVEDLPGPDHFWGQECARCHVTSSWAEVETTTPPPTTSGHPETPPDALCMDCHEVDRRSPTHYTDPEPWDCAPCHQQSGWSDAPIAHPARTPHGGSGACEGCHPASPPAFVCSSCHAAIFPHFGGASAPGAAADATCLGCHPGAL